jgi:hypothetical protein
MHKLYSALEGVAKEVDRLITTKPELTYYEERILKSATESVISYRRNTQ